MVSENFSKLFQHLYSPSSALVDTKVRQKVDNQRYMLRTFSLDIVNVYII